MIGRKSASSFQVVMPTSVSINGRVITNLRIPRLLGLLRRTMHSVKL